MPPSKKPIPKPRQTPSKKPAPKPRQAPYPTPTTPANPIPRSAPAGSFAPPLGFPSTFPNSAYPQYSLTPFELAQSFHDFCRDLQNGPERPPNVDENGSAGPAGVLALERDDQGASGVSKVGEGSSTGRKEGFEKIVGGDGVSKRRVTSKTPILSNRKKDKETMHPPSSKGQGQPATGHPEDLPPVNRPYSPAQHPHSPREPTPSGLAPPPTLTEEDLLAALLKPISDFNDRTAWPTTSHEQSHTPPDWHGDCPEGYAPTTLAGYPQRQYSTYIPAAHDAYVLREEYGHYCLDVDEWDRCCMGKCGGCEICRPHD